jgi:hypothetical protein
MTTAIEACEADDRRVHAKAKITFTDPLKVDPSLSFSSSGTAHGTEEKQVADSVMGSVYKWFSLANNLLDSTFHPLGRSVGWWSDVLSDGGGEFDPVVTLTIEMNPTIISHLLVYGDDKLGNYPIDFTVSLYDDEDLLLHEEPITNNDHYDWELELETPIEDVAKIVLEVTKISLPDMPAMITEMYPAYSELYEDDEIILLNILEERSYQGGTLPIGNVSANQCTLQLLNIDNKFTAFNPNSPAAALLKKNRKLEIWLGVEVPYGGEIVWEPMGVFYTQDWNAPNDQPFAEVMALDFLELMRTSPFYSAEIYEDKTLRELAEIVLLDYGLEEGQYVIGDYPSLSTVIPYAWFGQTTHRAALVEIAEAICGTVYCNREGKVVIEPFTYGENPKVALDNSLIWNVDYPMLFTQVVNYVEVEARPRMLGEQTVIYSDFEQLTVPAGGTLNVFCIFNTEDPCKDIQTADFTQSGADITVQSQTNYTWAASVTFANAGGGDQQVQSITIEGKILSVAGNKVAVAQDVASVAVDGKQSLSIPVQNNFIQSKAYAQQIADTLLAVYSDWQREVIFDCPGYIDLLLGDRISVKNMAGDYIDYAVLRQNIIFDGTMDATITAQKAIQGEQEIEE